MKFDISARLLVLLLALLIVGGAIAATVEGGISPTLAAILGTLAGTIPKMLEKPSITGDTAPAAEPAPAAVSVAREFTPAIVGAVSAGAITLLGV